jgi:glycosyltransferase involved in cell wall biosynthesis
MPLTHAPATAGGPIKVFTNMRGLRDVTLPGVATDVTVFATLPRGRGGLFALSQQLNQYDYVLVNCAPRELLHLASATLLNPFGRCKLVSLDTVLPVPRRQSATDRLRHAIKVALFKRVALFIEYFRDVSGYAHHYGMAVDKFRYVPFKINRYEQVLATPTTDEGYIFCGGNTRRDFTTLFEAVRTLPYPVRVVTMGDHVITGSGTTLDEHAVPPNVHVVRHDGSDSFLDHIAGARLVALPIKKENISASGIGVYLASMGLGKCVIISHGPAVDGVVPEGAAIVVPPEDPAALRRAIDRAYTDDAYRESVAARGKAYARGLAGEARLCQSVMEVLAADYTGRPFAADASGAAASNHPGQTPAPVR